MSPKELLYIEDALGHQKYLKTKCNEACQKLTDPELKQFVEQLTQQNQQMFTDLFQLI